MELGREDAFPSYSSGSTDQADLLPAVAAKRRRTRRRHRSAHPASANTASSSASSTEESGFTDDEGMANCLILLAQGGCATPAGKFTSKRLTEAETTAAGGRPGFYVYECKTCSKCFPSFQALGGHRASHKKLKMAAEAAAAAAEGQKKEVLNEVDHHLQIGMTNSLPKRTDAVGKGKVHECSICGSEFSSGQALGGHMRRHRPAMEVQEELKKEKNVVLALDLNLPAPAEDDGSFAMPGKPLVFSPAAALVDCHY